MANRRDFLKGASLLTLGALFSNCAKAEAAPKGGGPLGLQIYSLGPELSANGVAEGLKRIKESGYSYIELAGYRDGKIGQVEMAEFKKMADDAGIEIISSHLNPPVRDYSKDNFEEIKDFWKKATDDHKVLGLQYMVQPGLPNCKSAEDAQFVGEEFMWKCLRTL